MHKKTILSLALMAISFQSEAMLRNAAIKTRELVQQKRKDWRGGRKVLKEEGLRKWAKGRLFLSRLSTYERFGGCEPSLPRLVYLLTRDANSKLTPEYFSEHPFYCGSKKAQRALAVVSPDYFKKCVRPMLEKGLDPDQQVRGIYSSYSTPLIKNAIWLKNLEVVMALRNAGAQVDKEQEIESIDRRIDSTRRYLTDALDNWMSHYWQEELDKLCQMKAYLEGKPLNFYVDQITQEKAQRNKLKRAAIGLGLAGVGAGAYLLYKHTHEQPSNQ